MIFPREETKLTGVTFRNKKQKTKKRLSSQTKKLLQSRNLKKNNFASLRYLKKNNFEYKKIILYSKF